MTRSEASQRLDALDMLLILIFVIGIYLGAALPIAAGVPLPDAPAGIAGLILLLRHTGKIREREVLALLIVLILYLGNILCAPDRSFLLERVKGFIQLSYSLIICYGLFLAVTSASRRQIARLLFGFCTFLIVGCLLELHVPGFQALSDSVRTRLFDATYVYTSDARDEMLYGAIRPKLFTSEPSAVTFGFTLFAFIWLIVSTWRFKLIGYFALLAASFVIMRGPTLSLGLVLLVPYFLFLAPWRSPHGDRRLIFSRAVAAGIFGVVLAVVTIVIVSWFFEARLEKIEEASDPSFFYRIIGPPLVALEVAKQFPWTGAGLTGEEFIEKLVMKVYYASPMFSPYWRYDDTAAVLTNYFWHHWIYLGPIWGVILLAALSFWLKALRVPNLAGCWVAWIVLGQASGAYVSPKTWTVLVLTGAAAVLHARVARPVAQHQSTRPMPRWQNSPAGL